MGDAQIIGVRPMRLFSLPHDYRIYALLFSLLALLPFSRLSAAEADAERTQVWLKKMSLEDLMELDITSVGKKRQKVGEVAAAVFVITQDDIRRSGATHVAELLRMAPGIEVARTHAYGWRVAARGSFNGAYVNKLLVLIDGRSLYNLQVAGVFWDRVDALLPDIERIEVIRGPGGSLWGANAVNGIINIITKPAADTQGGQLSVRGGNKQRFAALRYGGRSDTTAYRVYAQRRAAETFGQRFSDAGRFEQAGFRLDGKRSAAEWTLHGDAYASRADDLNWQTFIPGTADTAGANLFARWQQNTADNENWSLQSYFDHSERETPTLGFSNQIFDIELQRRLSPNAQQELIWGLGYRWLRSEVPSHFLIRRAEPIREEQLFNAFIQTDIRLDEDDKWRLTLGSKFEHNDYTGIEIQPTARLLWTPYRDTQLWAAVSRAVRTPSQVSYEIEADLLLPPPLNPFYPIPLISRLRGNPEVDSESVITWEMGWRQRFDARVSLDLALFYNRYRELVVRTDTPFPDLANQRILLLGQYPNAMRGESFGLELALDWQGEQWKIQAAYSWLRVFMQMKDPSYPQMFESVETENPEHQLSLRYALNLNQDWTFSAWLRYTDDLGSETFGSVEDYWSFDARLAWRFNPRLEFSLVGQNLFDKRHYEYAPGAFSPLVTENPRRFYLQFKLDF